MSAPQSTTPPVAAAKATPKSSSTLSRLIVVLGSLGILGTAGAAGWWATQKPSLSSISSGMSSSAQSSAATDQVLATVDGQSITRMELAGQLNTGIDRAIVIDRYINKVLAAEQGKERYPEEAAAALRAAEREILATVFTTRRMQELRDSITDEEVQTFYNDNVLEDNFKQWKVSYYLTNDAQDAQSTLEKLKEGDKKALEKLSPLNDQGDGFTFARTMPYGLGRVVNNLEKGEFSEAMQVRNGFIMVRVDDFRQLDQPTVDDLRAQIIQNLATQKFNQEIEKARRAAQIELG